MGANRVGGAPEPPAVLTHEPATTRPGTELAHAEPSDAFRYALSGPSAYSE